MQKNKLVSLLALVMASLTLASCSTIEHPDFPTDYGDQVVSVTGSDGKAITVAFNYKRALYQDVGSVNEKALNLLLEQLSSDVSNGKVNGMTMYSSVVGDDEDWGLSYVSGVDNGNLSYTDLSYKGIGKEVEKRAQKAMLDKVTGGSYDTNNRFDEKKFALELNSGSNVSIDAAKGLTDKVVNKTSEYADVFTLDYSAYIKEELAPEIVRNKLTAQYIYNERYSSILNANARNVSVVALADDSNHKGAAQALINAYETQYLEKGQTIDPSYADDPLAELALLWKGIGGVSDDKERPETKDVVEKDYQNFLTPAQKAFLVDNKLETLYSFVIDDLNKIHLDNQLLTDKTLEDSYTGNGTYGLYEGTKRKIDSLVKKDVLTKGLYQESDLSSLPSAVTKQIFSATPNSVVATKGTHQYIIPQTSQSGVTDDITIYDKDSDTYYLAMMDVNNGGVLDSSYLGTKGANEADETKRAAAMDVAYKMVSTSTYKTDSVVYWIKKSVGNTDFTVNNKSFYDYLKSSYPDLFDDDVKY